MEPLSALSVAAAAVQFVDFTIKVVSSTCNIYRTEPGRDGDRNFYIKTITEGPSETQWRDSKINAPDYSQSACLKRRADRKDRTGLRQVRGPSSQRSGSSTKEPQETECVA